MQETMIIGADDYLRGVTLESFSTDDTVFVTQFEQRIKDTISTFGILDGKENIVVAASGGKDSTVVMYILKNLGYHIRALTVDTHIGCYTEQNLKNVIKFCESINVPLVAKDFNTEFGYGVCYLRDTLAEKGLNVKSCTVCGVPRRYLINKYTREMGADVVITGHNLDDECQAILMNYFRNTLQLSARLGPVPGVIRDPRFIPRAKPLYFLSNTEIERYSKLKGFQVAYGHCPCSTDAYRRHIKDWLHAMSLKHPRFKHRIITHFLANLPALRHKYRSDASPGECLSCGEPTSAELCKTCSIMQLASSPTQTI
ncbi:TIGR00269 family protein [Candidatus Woesearchaeota archaeon]|nr:TIGR00269 family protein [Candidatus Woesearchaeota archaeon]